MHKASAIFLSLPNEVRDRVKVFLTTREWGKLLAPIKLQSLDMGNSINPVNTINKRASNSIQANFHQLKNFLHAMNLSALTGKKKIIAKVYLIIFLLFTFFSLVEADYSVSVYLFLYAVFGYICLRRKSQIYWNIHFFESKFEPFFLLLSGYTYIFLILLIGYHIAEPDSGSYQNYKAGFSFIIQACFLGPVFEEIIFRGYIFEITAIGFHNKKYHEYVGIGVSSFLFAVIHINSPELTLVFKHLLLFFSAGFLLGLLRWYTKSLFYCILVHIAFNTTMFFV